MVNYSEWFTSNQKGKIQINSIAIYRDLSPEVVKQLDNNLSVSEIIDWIRQRTIQAFKSQYSRRPTDGALNNSVGRWNEFIATTLFSEIALDISQNNKICVTIFSLPNSKIANEDTEKAYSKFLTLFNPEEWRGGKKLSTIAPFKHKIFLPSPDYIIAVINDRQISVVVRSLLEKQIRQPDSLEIYSFLQGKLNVEEVKAVISLKTSNRPDRRYQPLFEAAMIKAMIYVLQQNWKYYMVASELTSADRTIFSTAIAPHGIAIEQDYQLVDGTYLYNRKLDLVSLVESAIHE
ncbi:MAG: Cfr10I/Bse634I family restriction endonuclease [Coleofasciculus sp. C1-SOL-03]|jgi:hypothetical protein|uniref:Cfr10I/Bse634I family restriction endonuclease n=1 Tax=Coleofasciculus sp. C1-SOL-03 TaxID=3069522 RepID=UPI0032F28D42